MIWLVLQLLYYDVQCKWRKWMSALARYEQDFPMQMLHEIEAPSRGKRSCCCKRGTVYCTSKTNLATCNQPFISISAWTRLTQLNSDKLSIDRYLTGYSAGFELRGNEGTAVHPRYLHVPKVNTSNFVELTFAKLSLWPVYQENLLRQGKLTLLRYREVRLRSIYQRHIRWLAAWLLNGIRSKCAHQQLALLKHIKANTNTSTLHNQNHMNKK